MRVTPTSPPAHYPQQCAICNAHVRLSGASCLVFLLLLLNIALVVELLELLELLFHKDRKFALRSPGAKQYQTIVNYTIDGSTVRCTQARTHTSMISSFSSLCHMAKSSSSINFIARSLYPWLETEGNYCPAGLTSIQRWELKKRRKPVCSQSCSCPPCNCL